MAERKGVTTKSTILVPSSSVPSAVEGGCALVVALFDLQQALCSTLSEIEVVIAIITSHQVRARGCSFGCGVYNGDK